MYILIVPLTVLWTVCTAKEFQDYYYQPLNVTRTTPVGIAAYRSALTLDWMSAEDSRQRELVSAFEQEPQFPSPISHSDCISYNRPTAGNVAKLMLEVLRNLEGDDGALIPNLVKSLVRAKLLMLETTMFENEPDFDALVKTPAAMIGEPHTTLPRIVEVLWMAITDPSTVKKHGWCTVHKMTSFIQASRPVDIAKNMRASEQIISRARFIMEEFIQHVTPLNMEKPSIKKTTTAKTQSPTTPLPPVVPSALGKMDGIKRPVRTHPEMQMKVEDRRIEELLLLKSKTTTTTTEEIETLPANTEDLTGGGSPQSFTSACAVHQTNLYLFSVLLFWY